MKAKQGLRSIAITAAVALTGGIILTTFPRSEHHGVLSWAYNQVSRAIAENSQESSLSRAISSRIEFRTKSSEESNLISARVFRENLVSKKGRKFEVARVELPNSINRDEYGLKPSGFADFARNGNALVVQGDGLIVLVDSDGGARSVPTNLPSLLPVETDIPDFSRIASLDWSVKGLTLDVDKANIFVSYSDNYGTAEEPCLGLSVASATYSEDRLNFERIWQTVDCTSPADYEKFAPHEIGGGIGVDQEGYLYIATGPGGNRPLAQDDGSDLGKVFRWSPKRGQEVLAKGLRNPQSLAFSGKNLLIVDQGPMGGDEINVLDNFNSPARTAPQNFGWPISAYGIHYDGKIRDEAPLEKSHAAFGFVEPSYIFSPSIGLSSIAALGSAVKIQGLAAEVVVGGLGENPIEGDESLSFLKAGPNGVFQLVDQLPVEERVRFLKFERDTLLIHLDNGSLLLISAK